MLGANGAGKSTAMRALSGLLRPVSGEIVLDDRSIARSRRIGSPQRASRWCRKAGRCFPNRRCTTTCCSAPTRGPTSISRHRVAALLERFPRLRERLHGRAGLLSGGEQQMLAIARGLMAKPRILLLDEPSLGLAPGDDQRAVRGSGRTARRRRHHPAGRPDGGAGARRVADRGYVLESGPHRARRPLPRRWRSDPELEAAYLGRAEAAQ